MINCIIAGVGGQGTVLVSKLIAAAAIKQGFNVRTTETIGMAQRGGCVVSHVRIGKNILSPLIPKGKADIIIAFEVAEALRVLPFIAKEGFVLVCNSAIKPVTSSLSGDSYEAGKMIDYLKSKIKNLTIISGEKLLEKCDSAKVMNVALLGAAVQRGALPFNIKDIEQAIKDGIPQRFFDMNMAALNIGREMYCETAKAN